MVFSILLFLLVYSVVFVGWFPAIMSRFGWSINFFSLLWGYVTLPVIGIAALLVRREAVFPEYLMTDDEDQDTTEENEEEAVKATETDLSMKQK